MYAAASAAALAADPWIHESISFIVNHIFYCEMKNIPGVYFSPFLGPNTSKRALGSAGRRRSWIVKQSRRFQQGGHRSIRSTSRPIELIDSIDSINFCLFENFGKDRLRRDDHFRPKIVKIRAILTIFQTFENFCEFRFDRFDRFDIPFDSINVASEGCGGPPWKTSCLSVTPGSSLMLKDACTSEMYSLCRNENM